MGILTYTVLLIFSSTTREVSIDTAKILFAIFSTPFILETTFALIGIFIVLGINHWRLSKEGDGWVYMATQENDAPESPTKSSQRLQSVIFMDKPLMLDQDNTTLDILEGYLDLGMAAQALKEMQEQSDLDDDARTTAIKIRILSANLDTASAYTLWKQGIICFPESQILFAQVLTDNVSWFQRHLPNHESILFWNKIARDFTNQRSDL